MDKCEGKNMEENENVVEDVKENDEEVHEDVKDEKPSKKVPWLTIVLAIAVVVLSVLLIMSKNQSSTYNLADVYPSYFAEKEGTIKFPKGWLADNQGNLFYNENGILTAKGIIMASDISEDEYNELIESSADYVELEQIENYKYTAYKGLYNIDSNSVYTFAYIYNNDQLIQMLLVDVTDDEFNSIVNSLSY